MMLTQKGRLTQRNYFGKAFVPGYAPRCSDKETCELLCKVTERLAVFEDMLDIMPPEIHQRLEKEGTI